MNAARQENKRRAVPGARLRLRALLGAAAMLLASGAAASAAESAVILMYHRFGEDAHPETNTRLAQFDAQIAALKQGYTVLPIPEIVAALQDGRPLPDRTIGLSIDVAYRSVYENAWPRLEAAGLPFTLFVDIKPLDRGYRGYMSWEQVRELARAGVTIGNQTLTHPNLRALDRAAARAEITGAGERLAAALGSAPRLFAYPYGEYDGAVRSLVAELGFAAAFGTQSGVVHAGADRFVLPRMAMNEAYGSMDRFRLVADALPLPVSDLSPADPVVTANPPVLAFTVAPGIGALDRLACYAAGQGRTALTQVGPRRFEARLQKPLMAGRWRVNCTLPAGEGRWRWLGALFIVPR